MSRSGAGRVRIALAAVRLGRAGAEPQLQPLGAAADDAAPEQALRRRGDDAGDRTPSRDDARG